MLYGQGGYSWVTDAHCMHGACMHGVNGACMAGA